MDVQAFGKILGDYRLTSGSGVPCSLFGGLFHFMDDDPRFRYVPAVSEGDAIAIAAGFALTGSRAFALMQNSGLGNAVNPITSLIVPYGVPITLFVSHRGEPGIRDEPQHERMGAITEELIRLCGLELHRLEAVDFAQSLGDSLTRQAAAAWLISAGALVGGRRLQGPPLQVGPRSIERSIAPHVATVTRRQALAALLPLLNGQRAPAVVSATGLLSRELFELDDADHRRVNRLYMVGSMGCAAAIGLGVASAAARRVLVLDGDGAALMRLGSLATVGARSPVNFHHIVFDNGAHDTTGGQPTSSPSVDFQALASACGYRRTATVSSVDELTSTVDDHLDSNGPTFLRMLITTGPDKGVGRPTLSPAANWARMQTWIQS